MAIIARRFDYVAAVSAPDTFTICDFPWKIERGHDGKVVEPRRCMSESIICVRAFEFASRILKLCERLWRRGPTGRQIAAQLIRCGPSIGANAEEAQDAQTKPDYVAKM